MQWRRQALVRGAQNYMKIICLIYSYNYKNTGTVHTSTKAHLTSIAIRIRHQYLIICSLAHWQPSLKISCRSVRTFLREVANRQTDK